MDATPRVRKLAAVLVTTAGISCAPPPVTEQGSQVADLYDAFMVVASVVFVVVAGLLGYSIIRFRARAGDDEIPKQFHSNVKLEITWFAIPQILVVVLFAMSAFVLDDIEKDPAGDGTAGQLLDVHVEAFRWGWRFEYEDEDVVILSLPEDPAEIALPVGRPVRFTLRSSDVIHSFWIPRWLVKRDVNVSEDNTVNVTITQEGNYPGQCAEFCGLLHDSMDFEVKAVPPEEFEEWLSQQQQESEV